MSLQETYRHWSPNIWAFDQLDNLASDFCDYAMTVRDEEMLNVGLTGRRARTSTDGGWRQLPRVRVTMQCNLGAQSNQESIECHVRRLGIKTFACFNVA